MDTVHQVTVQVPLCTVSNKMVHLHGWISRKISRSIARLRLEEVEGNFVVHLQEWSRG